MSRRSQLEHEVSLAQKRIKEAPQNTPANIRKIWEQELVELEVELNNLTDEEEDNNNIHVENGPQLYNVFSTRYLVRRNDLHCSQMSK